MSISIPQVRVKVIRSLLYTVMRSTSAAHRLASNSVMSFGYLTIVKSIGSAFYF